jgi:hypothetical protein
MEEDQKEIIKAGAEALVKPVADLINKRFGGAAEQIGGMWTDELAARRRVRQIALYLKVKKAIDGAGFEPQQIPDRIWVPILREASLEDDETLQTKWANLLANAADPQQKTAVLPSFSSIMADLNSVQAKFLETLYKQTLQSEGRYLSLPKTRSDARSAMKMSARMRFLLGLLGTLPRIERSLVSRTKGWPPEIRPEKMVSIGSGGDSLVAMMQSADLRHLRDSALVRSLNRSAARSVLAQRQMRSRPLVVFEI